VSRPQPAAVLKMSGRLGMPITRRKDRPTRRREFPNEAVEHRHDGIAFSNRQASTRTEIVLDVDNQERLFALHSLSLY